MLGIVLLIALVAIFALSIYCVWSCEQFRKLKVNCSINIGILKTALEKIENADLSTLFQIHKELGVSNLSYAPSIRPEEFGVFRTIQIASMCTTEVYLGNVDGLWTHSLEYWLRCTDKDAVRIVTEQYRGLLRSGIKTEIQDNERKIQS